MKRPRINILRTFEAAGRRLSFSQAAEDLNISQAAVSQQIRQLEAYLNSALFVRHHRRLSLTGTGQAYLDAVHEALDRLDSVTDRLFPEQHGRMVTLRCTSAVATLWIAPRLKQLRKSHAEIELRIETPENNRISESNLEIFIAGDDFIAVQAEKLLTATITPVCSPKLFTRSGRPENPRDLLEFDLIHVLGYDDDWHRWFRKHDKQKINIPGGLSVDGSLIAIEAAQRGDGIMLGRRPFIDRHLETGDLVEVFSKPYHLHADYYLRQPPKTMLRRENRIVANWLNQLAGNQP